MRRLAATPRPSSRSSAVLRYQPAGAGGFGDAEVALVTFQLNLARRTSDDDELEQAVTLAGEADVAVAVVGTTEAVESEGFDRDTLALPGRRDELVRRVAAVHPRTVVVVNAGASADPGQEVTVQVTVPARSLAHWDGQTHTWTIEQGRLRLAVGPPTATNASPSRSRPAPEAPLSW